MKLVAREVGTPLGPARVHLARPAGGAGAARGTLLLGHGAGGGIAAADLQAVAGAAVDGGWVVGLVEQPWRVAGRRVAPSPPTLDLGWRAVIEAIDTGRSRLPRPFVFGGRSAGARVACRLAEPLGAVAVVALAFPLHPPGRPERSRLAELMAAVEHDGSAGVPVLVVQGERDPFGGPGEFPVVAGIRMVGVPGDHGLKGSVGAAAEAARGFLADLSAPGQ